MHSAARDSHIVTKFVRDDSADAKDQSFFAYSSICFFTGTSRLSMSNRIMCSWQFRTIAKIWESSQLAINLASWPEYLFAVDGSSRNDRTTVLATVSVRADRREPCHRAMERKKMTGQETKVSYVYI